MKYQQLENLECGWKWQYLIKKWKEGDEITRHIDSSEADSAVKALQSLEHEPTLVLDWIEEHMALNLDNKMKQAIRAKRKRHFNAEQIHTKKKSIDLDYRVWEKLSYRANELGCTLSDAIEYLLTEASRSEKASQTVNDLKQDLSKLLSN
ncbi:MULTISPECIES: macrodomain Ter protein MatP [Vibrio]|uniref:Macrodomain Ter protein n=1 Tax=Vibrio genomosp. F10 str. ZF-129 TaxID=1187848 RepID=A0A1E5BFL7_9VIBR|nr:MULTISPECIES: macrodomain Ter protein MatP [Vibrio]OEE34608.1 Ter macrodomain-binding protein MatP [Vibrio genomosp. F10 str. ZF-129]OEE94764.1 Ter macrodomain-binding protein MatP [Vibrio genomosp. F10 str. 9ZD137]OEE96411.1 Ter macrodomain-binding protein MatP [Vibrio genomosp. F10 str. 9ZC157]OEF05166.1 Ter macrodomain-binding protein MatP [Vibrio genomosp. F10 str. 9ZB36]WGW01815.1 macrodomain Ter protein MatP [Vibrio sp. YMD68]